MALLTHKDSYEVIDPPSPIEQYLYQLEQSIDELDKKIKDLEKNLNTLYSNTNKISLQLIDSLED